MLPFITYGTNYNVAKSNRLLRSGSRNLLHMRQIHNWEQKMVTILLKRCTLTLHPGNSAQRSLLCWACLAFSHPSWWTGREGENCQLLDHFLLIPFLQLVPNFKNCVSKRAIDLRNEPNNLLPVHILNTRNGREKKERKLSAVTVPFLTNNFNLFEDLSMKCHTRSLTEILFNNIFHEHALDMR